MKITKYRKKEPERQRELTIKITGNAGLHS
jgi:hypothetical protein